MTRFRFHIIDATGRRRKGVLLAESQLEAETVLRSKLCVIEELTPLEDDPSRIATPLANLEAAFTLADRVRAAIIACLVALLVISLTAWARSSKPKPPPQRTDLAKPLELTVRGRLDTSRLMRASNRLSEYFSGPSDLTAYAVFPQLAYEVAAKIADDGTFEAPVSLAGVERPHQVQLEVALGQQRWPVSALLPLPAKGSLDVGMLIVEPPKESPARETNFNLPPLKAPTVSKSPTPHLTPEQRRARGLNRIREHGG